MAEYDNLLTDAETVARRSNKNGDTRRIENLAAAVRALQTENTELRADRDDMEAKIETAAAMVERGLAAVRAATVKLTTAERVIAKAVNAAHSYPNLWDSIDSRDDFIAILSSYPLGEGQTQEEGKA